MDCKGCARIRKIVHQIVTFRIGRFRGAVPSGASTGVHEAVELRDGDKSNYVGKGVSKAVANVNNVIAPALISSGLQVTAQKDIDDFLIKLDNTANKGNLGANAILAVSIAVAEAGAAEKSIPLYKHLAELAGVKPPFVLPTPCFNVINGGSHAGNKLAFQEFMLVPIGAASFTEAMKIGTETYHTLKKVVSAKYGKDGLSLFYFKFHASLTCGYLHKLSTLETKEGLPQISRVLKTCSIYAVRRSKRLATRGRSRLHLM